MIISELEIPEQSAGLRPGRLKRLGRVVVLAGPNGGGKSRTLRAVEQACQNALVVGERLRLESEKQSLRSMIERFRRQVDESTSTQEIASSKSQIENHERRLDEIERQITAGSMAVFEGGPISSKPRVVRYSLSNLELKSSGEFRTSELRQALDAVSGAFGIGTFKDYVLAAITQIAQDAAFARGAPDGEYGRDAHLKRHRLLSIAIQEFLGCSLEWSYATNEPTLFGLPIDRAQLSDGQRILLAIATSLALQDGRSEDLVLLLDEPENHLHPRALIDLLRRIDAACPHAQLWIATHSIHVLAHYGEQALWAAKDGVISFAGRRYKEVLDSLVGADEDLAAVTRFMSLPAQQALVSFAAECLVPPNVAETHPGDAQTTQIRQKLQSLSLGRTPLRVLDYGAGKGRLLGELSAKVGELSGVVDYYAFDIAATDELNQRMCKRILEDAYPGEASLRYLLGEESLCELAPGTFDCVVLCNVLHELPLDRWVKVLGPGGTIASLLAEHGVLLIVEDQLLAFGEKAHDFGFLVLDQPELQRLFATSGADEIVTSEHPQYPGRLKLHAVNRRQLEAVELASVVEALECLKGRARRMVEETLRNPDEIAGRRYAFWTVQYVNADRALTSMKHKTGNDSLAEPAVALE